MICNFYLIPITCILHRIQRLPFSSGSGRIFSAEQEAVVMNGVVANNALSLPA